MESRTSLSRILHRLFSFPVAMGALLVGAVFSSSRSFRVDPDLWWHIKVGETILATHRWPIADPYSFTVSGQPWLAYEWLGDILSALAYRIAGIQGLEVLLIVLGSAVILALYAFASVRSGNSKAGCVTAIALFLLADVSFSLRPLMLGYLFLILTLLILERFRQGKHATIWFLPLIMLLWVNTHGSWIVGLGAIFVYWMSGLVKFRMRNLEVRPWTSEERLKISFSFLMCLLALPITPYGTRIAVSPFEFAFSLPLNIKYINEWQSMPFSMVGGKLFLALLLGLFVMQIVSPVMWRIEELALFLFGTVMACLHVRFLLVFVPFVTPLLATILSPWVPRYHRAKDKLALNAAIVAAITVAMIFRFPSRAELQHSVAAQFPVAAVEYLQQHPVPEPMFNDYGFGGYLVLSRGPEHKVFIDGRGDVYERGGLLADYIHITRIQPGALAVLDNYGVQSCLIERDAPLATLLSSSSKWKRVYFDNTSALFVRIGSVAKANQTAPLNIWASQP
jgi:hypothetical protein